MKKLNYYFLLLILQFALAGHGRADHTEHGIITVSSKYSVVETADRLESLLDKKGFTIFARVKHSESASKVGVELRPTELVIFGNPKVGSKIMKCQQSVAIDLPQKALVWQDENDEVWFSYNDMDYLANRHHIKGCEKVIKKVKGALAKFANVVTN